MDALQIIIPIVWVVIGFTVLYKMAESRGRRPVLWGVFGAITFLIALIAILVVGPSDDRA